MPVRIPVAREGALYIAVSLALALILLLIAPLYSVLPALAAAAFVFFFREPARRPPKTDNGEVIAPACGRVMRIDEVEENSWIEGRARRVSIFMSLLNVHINYAPVTGSVDYIRYREGSFRNAMEDVSSEVNESNTIGFKSAGRLTAIRQIAGMIARRIVCRCAVGDCVRAGEAIGMIKFSSRVDIFLPLSAHLLVNVGEKVRGGETVVARIL